MEVTQDTFVTGTRCLIPAVADSAPSVMRMIEGEGSRDQINRFVFVNIGLEKRHVRLLNINVFFSRIVFEFWFVNQEKQVEVRKVAWDPIFGFIEISYENGNFELVFKRQENYEILANELTGLLMNNGLFDILLNFEIDYPFRHYPFLGRN